MGAYAHIFGFYLAFKTKPKTTQVKNSNKTSAVSERSAILETGRISGSEGESHGTGWTGGRELLLCFAVLLGAVHSGKKSTVVIKLQVMRDCLAKRLSCVHGQERSCMKRTCRSSKFAFQKLGLDGCLREVQLQLDESNPCLSKHLQ